VEGKKTKSQVGCFRNITLPLFMLYLTIKGVIMMSDLIFDSSRRHHKKKNIDPERMKERLCTAHWGTLATCSEDCEPYCVPIGFAYEEDSGNILFHTAVRGMKLDNINRDSRVCFSIVASSDLVTEKFAATFESLVIFGTIEKVPEDEALAAAVTFCSKFAPQATGQLLMEEVEDTNAMAEMMHKASQYMAMFRLIPSHISSKKRVLDI
jgi:nitroimidazol reductase NimA-like FMN-containing flavoprotein (pyridoxamine 5'-phosphate oxidase superfamily)